jgi:hypothetical protein
MAPTKPDSPADTAAARQQNQTPPGKEVQGEGDYDAGRRYDKATREFAESGRVEPAARDAAPADAREAEELERAEQAGRSHSKGEDPLLKSPRKTGG